MTLEQIDYFSERGQRGARPVREIERDHFERARIHLGAAIGFNASDFVPPGCL